MHILSVVLAALQLHPMAASTLSTSDSLSAGFRNPPPSAQAWTWWHWINGNISKQGITADLEAMHRVGIHGVQIFNVDQNYPEGSASFMTPQWLDLVQFAGAEAKRLGLELGFHNAAGWSSSGGPWITPELAMQTVVTSETPVHGGTTVRVALPQPPTKLGYYRDIAVLAYPHVAGNARIENLGVKSLSGAEFQYNLHPDLKPVPSDSVIPKTAIVDLSSKMSPSGELVWDAPQGEWTVLRIGHTPRGEENHPAGIGGKGLECDKLSRAALDAHWAGGIQPVLDKVGKTFTSCLIDSYEVGANNWTPKLREEFIKRRGYDPTPYLPTLSGHYAESAEVAERFLWDLRRTIGDLFAENYYGYFCDLCKAHGLLSCIEPYEGPFEELEVAAKADMPMGEFWVGSSYLSGSASLAASVSHVQGNPIVGAEAFTANGENSKWLHHPATIKALGDWAWSLGVNRFVFHTYAHQPWMNVVPGMTFHMYGTPFSRLNTWWEQSKAWMSYLSRSQFLLQQGRCAADVLYFAGEDSPNPGAYHPELKALGFNYDAIGTRSLFTLQVKDGDLCTPSGGRYRLLVLPNTTWMTPSLVRQVKNLATAGATVVGSKPTKSPSLQGFPECDFEVARLAEEVWGQRPGVHRVGKGQVISDRPVEQVLSEMKVAPDFAVRPQNARIAFTHRMVEDTDVYFVSNQESSTQNLECTFRVKGKRPEVWNPESGQILTPAVWHEKDGRTVLPLTLEGTGSAFVVFRKGDTQKLDPIVHTDFNLDPVAERPLPDLRIVRALYGVFPPDGLVDVTEPLIKHLADGKLQVTITNDLAGDPTPGTSKELRVEYTLDGITKVATVLEHCELKLPSPGETGSVKLLRAYYGKFATDLGGMPPAFKTLDVTEQIASLSAKGKLNIHIDNALFGFALASPMRTELRLDYTVDGDPQHAIAKENSSLCLTLESPQPSLSVVGDHVMFTTPQNGSVHYTTVAGTHKTLTVRDLPDPIELKGSWEVSFQQERGAPPNATFDQLISWPHHQDQGIRYFSGTATYHKTIEIPASYLGKGRTLELDLGRVAVIAEVKLNGKDLGILWKAPFRVSLDSAAKVGANELEIRVTNLWPNRLIRDA